MSDWKPGWNTAVETDSSDWEDGWIKAPEAPKESGLQIIDPLQEGVKDVAKSGVGFLKMMADTARGSNADAFRQKVHAMSDSDMLKPDPGYKKSEGFSGYVEDVVRMSPQVAVQLGIAMTPGGQFTSATFMGSQIAGGKYETLREDDVPVLRAVQASLADAAMQAPLEALSLNKALRAWKPGKKAMEVARDIAGAAGTEALTEAVQKYPDLATEIWAKSKDVPVEDQVNQFVERFGQATKEGIYEGLVAAPFGGMARAAKITLSANDASPDEDTPDIGKNKTLDAAKQANAKLAGQDVAAESPVDESRKQREITGLKKRLSAISSKPLKSERDNELIQQFAQRLQNYGVDTDAILEEAHWSRTEAEIRQQQDREKMRQGAINTPQVDEWGNPTYSDINPFTGAAPKGDVAQIARDKNQRKINDIESTERIISAPGNEAFQTGLADRPNETQMPMPEAIPTRPGAGSGYKPFAGLQDQLIPESPDVSDMGEIEQSNYDDGLDVSSNAIYRPKSETDQTNFQSGLQDEYFGNQDLSAEEIAKMRPIFDQTDIEREIAEQEEAQWKAEGKEIERQQNQKKALALRERIRGILKKKNLTKKDRKQIESLAHEIKTLGNFDFAAIERKVNDAKINAARSDVEQVDRETNQYMAGHSDFNEKLNMMQQEVNNSETRGVTQEKANQQSETVVYGASSPSWMKDIQAERKANGEPALSRKELNVLFDKARSGQKMTERQASQFEYVKRAMDRYTGEANEFGATEDAQDMERKGFEPMGGASVPITDLKEGDKFIGTVDGVKDEYTVKDMDKNGDVLIQDGVTRRVDMFDEVSVEGIKRNTESKKEVADSAQSDYNTINEPAKKYTKGHFNESTKAKQLDLFEYKPEKSEQTQIKAKLRANQEVSTAPIAGVDVTESRYVVQGAEDAASVLSHLVASPQENAYFLPVDKDGNVLEFLSHSIGLKSSSQIDPATGIGRVFRNKKAHKIYFVHNHPSGEVDPSSEDINITKKIQQMAALRDVEVVPMVIGTDGFAVFNTKGEYSTGKIKDTVKKSKIPVQERVFKKKVSTSDKQIQGAQDLVKRLKDEQDGFLLVDGKLREVGFLPFPSGLPRKEIAARVLESAEKTNASGVFINNKPPAKATGRKRFLQTISDGFHHKGIEVYDILSYDKYGNPQHNPQDIKRSEIKIALPSLNDSTPQFSVAGDRIKTPNDKVSPLLAEDQTETKAFKKWFGNSKVVDEDGAPLVVYRGDYRADKINGSFRVVSQDEDGSGGVYFTDDPEIASNYSKSKPYIEDDAYDLRNHVKVTVNGKRVALGEANSRLKTKDKKRIEKTVLSYGENPETYEYDYSGTDPFIGEHTWKQYLQENRYNYVDAMYSVLMESGVMTETDEFMGALNQTGVFEDAFYDDPYAPQSGVFPVYLSIKNPIITTANNEALIKEFEKHIDGYDATLEALKDAQTTEYPDAVSLVTDEFREVAKNLGYDGIADVGGAITNSKKHGVYIVFDSTQIKSAYNTGTWDGSNPDIRFQTDQKPGQGITLDQIKSQASGQQITTNKDGSLSIRFKNGKGVRVTTVEHIGGDDVRFAMESGRMGKNGKILGKYQNGEVVLNTKLGDIATVAHEFWHMLKDFGILNKMDLAVIRNYHKKLVKQGQYDYEILEDQEENEANTFGQMIKNRADFREKSAMHRVIQKVMDFFDGLVHIGRQSARKLAREYESGKIYSRAPGVNQFSQSPKMSIAKAADKIRGMAAFKKWFGDSKVVDKKGKPLVVYHGTDVEITAFDPDKLGDNTGAGSAKEAFFFAGRKKTADYYSKGKYANMQQARRAAKYKGTKGPNTIPVYLSMQNPLIYDFKGKVYREQKYADLIKEAKKKGHDGVIFRRTFDRGGYGRFDLFMKGQWFSEDVYAVFSPTQIKSIYNAGAWDKDNPDIRYSTDADKKGAPSLSVSSDRTLPQDSPITEQDYLDNRKQQGNLKLKAAGTVARIKREVAKGADKFLGSVSTRLKMVSPKLSAKVRTLDFDINTKSAEDLKTALPLLKKAKRMTKEDMADWDYARKNSDSKKLNELSKKYGIEKEYQAVRTMLDRIREEAIDVGYDVGEIKDYWPRVLKDQEGFLKAIGKGPERPEFTDILKKKAKDMWIEVGEMDDSMKADIISNMILGKYYGIPGPGGVKQRVFEKIPKGFNQFYMDSDAALMQHIHSMRKRIEARRFFGKVPDRIAAAKTRLRSAETRLRKLEGTGQEDKINDLETRIGEYRAIIEKYKHQNDFEENIGAYVLELLSTGEISDADQNTVKEILTARFNEHGTRGLINAYKNLSYIDTMGSPISAITQIGDLAWAAYEGGMIPALKHAYKAARGKSKITKEDVGVERIAQEFADADTLSRAVSKVFRYVGLEAMDSIGKESLLNTAYEKYQKAAKQDPTKLKREIQPIFGKETDAVVDDLVNGEISDNVKLLVYHRLLDFQPVALSEMPEKYLTAGNGRVFYMLKTFTLKQFDVFRKEVYVKLRKGDKAEKVQAMKNFVSLASLFVLANAGADELKDFLLGRDTDLEDRVVDNVLRLFGISKFVTWKARTEGAGSSMARQILPPFKFIDAATKDIVSAGDDKGLHTVASIPLVGKLAYWHMGRGRHNRGDRWDRNWLKEKRRLNKVKDRLEQSDNKGRFTRKHKKELMALKRVNKIQGKLNKYKRAINLLKAKPQTEAVEKRIANLEKRRVNLIRRYFGRAGEKK